MTGFQKMPNWKKISESQCNSFPLEWQRFCQKLLHFGPFCIALNFKGSQLWKVELISDFFIHLSTFLFSAPCVGGASFVVENLKRGESLKAMWLSGGGARLIFWWSQALHPSMPWICFQLLKFNFTVSLSSLFVLALNGPIGISGQLLSA